MGWSIRAINRANGGQKVFSHEGDWLVFLKAAELNEPKPFGPVWMGQRGRIARFAKKLDLELTIRPAPKKQAATPPAGRK